MGAALLVKFSQSRSNKKLAIPQEQIFKIRKMPGNMEGKKKRVGATLQFFTWALPLATAFLKNKLTHHEISKCILLTYGKECKHTGLILGEEITWLIQTVPRNLFSNVRSHNFFLSLRIHKIASEEDICLSLIAPRHAFFLHQGSKRILKSQLVFVWVFVALIQSDFPLNVMPNLWNYQDMSWHQ